MHRRIATPLGIAVLALGLLATMTSNPTHGKSKKGKQPDAVVVQHCLIGFKGKVPGKEVTRQRKEAQTLAEEIFERAQAGEDFDAMVKEYTDDKHPGIYKLTNRGAAVRTGWIERDKFVARFGDVAFDLEVGEVGMANWNAATSPYGWHIIKRLE